MRRIMALLGVAGGFALARALDSAWVTIWYAGDRALALPAQAVLDAGGLAAAGALAGWLGLWLAGSSARGIGLWIGLLLLFASAVDFTLEIANAPRWHELLTALVMVPAAMIGGGTRLSALRARARGRHRRVPA